MQKTKFQKQLLAWYAKHGRPLPWRASHDPYSIWISEIMLQQTTVTAVIPYFERFMAKFPSVQALASAPEEEVLKLWEGLGYYSRARNLHQSARVLMERYHGVFPQSVEQLLELPGIGRYTAGAISSFAFRQPAPIVEANTQRLYARILGYDGELKNAAGQKVLWGFAETIVAGKKPDLINQALMELGSLVCKPIDPLCDQCPIQQHCRAFQEARQAEIPRALARPVITPLIDATLLIEFQGELFLRQREKPERWAGLWDFPRYTLFDPEKANEDFQKENDISTSALALSLKARVQEQLAVHPGEVTEFSRLTHGVTRYRITLHAFCCDLSDGVASRQSKALYEQLKSHGGWFGCELLDSLAMPVTTRKLVKQWQKLKNMMR